MRYDVIIGGQTLPDGVALIGSYHPSRQNTNTGKLTEEVFDAVFARARAVVGDGRDNLII